MQLTTDVGQARNLSMMTLSGFPPDLILTALESHLLEVMMWILRIDSDHYR